MTSLTKEVRKEFKFEPLHIIMLMFMFAGVLMGVFYSRSQRIGLSVADQARVAENKTMIGHCYDAKLCIGGFVRFRNGRIARIEYCRDNCQVYEIGITQLLDYKEMGTVDPFLAQLEIIPPGERSRWEAAAVDYARQFTVRQ